MICPNPALTFAETANQIKALRDLADLKEKSPDGYLAGVAPHLTPEDLRRKADALAQLSTPSPSAQKAGAPTTQQGDHHE